MTPTGPVDESPTPTSSASIRALWRGTRTGGKRYVGSKYFGDISAGERQAAIREAWTELDRALNEAILTKKRTVAVSSATLLFLVGDYKEKMGRRGKMGLRLIRGGKK